MRLRVPPEGVKRGGREATSDAAWVQFEINEILNFHQAHARNVNNERKRIPRRTDRVSGHATSLGEGSGTCAWTIREVV